MAVGTAADRGEIVEAEANAVEGNSFHSVRVPSFVLNGNEQSVVVLDACRLRTPGQLLIDEGVGDRTDLNHLALEVEPGDPRPALLQTELDQWQRARGPDPVRKLRP